MNCLLRRVPLLLLVIFANLLYYLDARRCYISQSHIDYDSEIFLVSDGCFVYNNVDRVLHMYLMDDVIIDENITVNNPFHINGGGRRLFMNSTNSINIHSNFGTFENMILDGSMMNESSNIVLVQSNLILENTNITNVNQFNRQGFLFLDGSTVNIRNGSISDSVIQDFLFNARNSQINIDNSVFLNFYANNTASIIRLQGSRLNISESQFIQCSGVNGSVVNAESSIINVGNSQFQECRTLLLGGVMIINGSEISIVNSSFSDCSANYYGGVIHSQTSRINISTTDFNNCGAGVYGGVFYILDTNLSISDARFVENYCSWSGGVAYGNNSHVNVVNSHFNNSRVGYFGGVFCLSETEIGIDTSEFHHNSANYYGGVLYGSNLTNSVISNSYFFNITSYSQGGAIMVVNSLISTTNNTFDQCSSSYNGGAIYGQSSDINVISSNFLECTSNSSGGALNINNCKLNLASSNFQLCTSVYTGGVLESNNDSNVHFTGNTIIMNECNLFGQMIFSTDSALSIERIDSVGFDGDSCVHFIYYSYSMDRIDPVGNTRNAIQAIYNEKMCHENGDILCGNDEVQLNIGGKFRLVKEIYNSNSIFIMDVHLHKADNVHDGPNA